MLTKRVIGIIGSVLGAGSTLIGLGLYSQFGNNLLDKISHPTEERIIASVDYTAYMVKRPYEIISPFINDVSICVTNRVAEPEVNKSEVEIKRTKEPSLEEEILKPSSEIESSSVDERIDSIKRSLFH